MPCVVCHVTVDIQNDQYTKFTCCGDSYYIHDRCNSKDLRIKCMKCNQFFRIPLSNGISKEETNVDEVALDVKEEKEETKDEVSIQISYESNDSCVTKNIYFFTIFLGVQSWLIYLMTSPLSRSINKFNDVYNFSKNEFKDNLLSQNISVDDLNSKFRDKYQGSNSFEVMIIFKVIFGLYLFIMIFLKILKITNDYILNKLMTKRFYMIYFTFYFVMNSIGNEIYFRQTKNFRIFDLSYNNTMFMYFIFACVPEILTVGTIIVSICLWLFIFRLSNLICFNSCCKSIKDNFVEIISSLRRRGMIIRSG